MINLIPPQGQTALKHEYMLRVWTVCAILFSGATLIGIVLLIPTYVFVGTQQAVSNISDAETAEIANEFSRIDSGIKSTNVVLLQLGTSTQNLPASKLIAEIVAKAPTGITFTTFQINESRSKDGATTIDVQGKSVSRGALAGFKNNLEASPYFKSVALPISDLARDADLPFAITLTLNPPTK